MNRTHPNLRDKLGDFIKAHSLIVILILAGILRIIYFVGIQLADDLFYIKYVHDLLEGGFRLPMNHWETRWGLVLPVYLFSRIFGFNEYGFAVFPFICSLANIILIYYIAENLFKRRTGVISAILLGVFPLDLYFSTSVYPTVPLATMCGLSVYFILRSKSLNRNFYCFWSGSFMGMAYLIHSTGLFLALFLVPYILFIVKGQKVKRFIFLSIGILIVLIAEMGAYSIIAHNPFHGMANVTKSFELNPPSVSAVQATEGVKDFNIFLKDREAQIQRGGNFWVEPLWTLITQQEFGIYYYFIIPLTLYFLMKRKKSEGIKVMLIWFVPVILYLFYGTVSPFEYRPLRRWPRYFSLINLPMIILLSAFLGKMFEKNKKRLAFLILALLVSTSLIVVTIDNWHRYAHVQREVGMYMKTHDGIYFAKGTYWHLGPFVKYDSRLLKRFDEQEILKVRGQKEVYMIYSQRTKEGVNFPVIKTFETPKTIFVDLARKVGCPKIIIEKLWRREIYFIARVS